MTIPTEAEIFRALVDALKGAADDCRQLGRLLVRGPTLIRLQERLKIATGACRSIAWIRDDAGGVGAPLGFAGTHGLEGLHMGKTESAGWLEQAHMFGELHQRVGDWCRAYVSAAERESGRILFEKAANVLDEMRRQIERRYERPVGKSTLTHGAVMPPMRPGPHRETRPTQVIIPEGITKH